MFNYPFTNDKEVIMKHSLDRPFYISFLLIISSVIFSVHANAISSSASVVQAGESYSINYEYYDFLEEKIGENGSWSFVSGANGTAEISGRPEGVYYYRAVVIDFNSGFPQFYYSNEISVNVYSGPPIEVDGIWDQKDYIYQVRKGDVNGDGKQDLFVNRISGGNSNNGVLNKTILQQQADKTFSVLTATPAQLNAAASWATASVEVVLSDFNMDGYVDLILKGIDNHITGANNQMVFSKGQLFSGQASSVRDIDEDFFKTFSSIAHWLGDSNYFEDNIITVTGHTYVLTYGCGFDWFYGEYVCGFYYVLVPYTVTGYDASLISQDALDLRDAMEPVLSVGEITSGSTIAIELAEIFENIIGDVLMADVYREPNTVLSHESGIPSQVLPEYRLGALLSAFTSCESEGAVYLGMSFSGAACAAGVILEPGPFSEITCACYYIYRAGRILTEVFGDEAANDDNDCETWRELLQEQKANANQLFIAGAITLAEYNKIVDTHNQSVQLFEELCGAAPELYL